MQFPHEKHRDIEWNNAFFIILIRAYREQVLKGTYDDIFIEKRRETVMVTNSM